MKDIKGYEGRYAVTKNGKELSEIDAKYREDVDLGHKTLCIDTDDYIALYNMAEYSEILMQEEEESR